MALKWTPISNLTLWATGSTAAVADATVSAVSAEFSNQTALDLYGWLQFTGTWAVAPSNTSPGVDFYVAHAPDGTNFADALAATLAPQQEHMRLASLGVRKVTTAQRIVTGVFPISPFKQRLYMDNRTGQTLPAGWGVTLYYGSLVSS